MRGKWGVIVVSFVGPVLVGLLDFFGKSIPVLSQLTETQQLRLDFFILVCTLLVVVNLVFGLSISSNESAVNSVESVRDSLLSGLGAMEGRISLLTSESLYRELKSAAGSAKSRIYTTYMGPSPATKSAVPSKKAYFAFAQDAAKSKPAITMRRVILYTPDNKPWIKALMAAYNGCTNVSLAVYRPSPDSALPLSLSLFDDNKCFIVHAADRPPGSPRDIQIVSKKVSGLLDGYYDSVWRKSTLVLDSGQEVIGALDRVST